MKDKHICRMKVLRQEKGREIREEEAQILSEFMSEKYAKALAETEEFTD